MKKINKVGVIGAGTMGAGIAGQVANAGIEVWLLDLPSDNESVNSLAERGLERLKDPDMPGIMQSESSRSKVRFSARARCSCPSHSSPEAAVTAFMPQLSR